MKRLGTALHIINDKTMIVKCDDIKSIKSFKKQFRINSTVVTKSVKSIGKLKDIIGPIDCPYASIRIFKKVSTLDLKKCINERVYVQ